MPDKDQLSRSHASIRWTNTVPQRRQLSDWGDIQVTPASPESEFCSVKGQGDQQTPMLERIAGTLVESVEGLSNDVLQLDLGNYKSRVILPVIVTNAALLIGQFDPTVVDKSSGEVEDADFHEVPHLRFRKSLSMTSMPDDPDGARLRDLAAASERTVFVVNAAAFPAWLRALDVGDSSPWINARDRDLAGG